MNTVQEALSYINPVVCTYDEWVRIGMAVKAAGGTLENWEAWSARDAERYSPEVCKRKWDSFKGHGVTAGTLWYMAMRGGWRPPERVTVVLTERVRETVEPTPLPTEAYASTAQWIGMLYDEDELVRLVEDRGNGPAGRGRFETAQWWKDSFEGGMAPPQYIGINPCKDETGSDKGVSAYRYMLVECDEIPIEQQWTVIQEAMGVMPIVSVVFSGGKSLHTLVYVDAQTPQEYREAAEAVYGWFQERGMPVDTACKNPGRLSRVGGAYRGDVEQRVLFVAPYHSMNKLNPTLLKLKVLPILLRDLFKTPPVQRDWCIRGLVRRNTLVCVSGRAKAGKSFVCIAMAAAWSTGGVMFGLQFVKNRVLHVDLELHTDTIHARYQNIIAGMGGDPDLIHILPMRRQSPNLDEMIHELGLVIPMINPDVVIIDPVYRLAELDEIDAKQVSKFLRDIATIAHNHRVTLVYTHHHRKGNLSDTAAIDRTSGSGAWGRMPDAMVDLTVLGNYLMGTAVKVEFVAREVPPLAPKYLYFHDGIFDEIECPQLEDKQDGKDRKNKKSVYEPHTSIVIDTRSINSGADDTADSLGYNENDVFNY